MSECKLANSLEVGKNYTFKSMHSNIVYTGVFLNYDYRTIHPSENKIRRCVFDVLDAHYPGLMMLSFKNIQVIPAKGSLIAKQVARGLCDRIPEDCAGIIERMLVGNQIVGKGPDRYPERC